MVPDALFKIKNEQDPTLAFRRDEHRRQEHTHRERRTRAYLLPHMFVVHDLVTNMNNFYDQYASYGNRKKPGLFMRISGPVALLQAFRWIEFSQIETRLRDVFKQRDAQLTRKLWKKATIRPHHRNAPSKCEMYRDKRILCIVFDGWNGYEYIFQKLNMRLHRDQHSYTVVWCTPCTGAPLKAPHNKFPATQSHRTEPVNMAARFLNRVAGIGATVGIGGFCIQECIYDVDGGHRAVIFDRKDGILDKSVGEGTHFKIPFFQYPTILDVRSNYRLISSRTGTKDLQNVNISLRCLYRPNADKLSHIYAEYGSDYADRILPSVGNEVLKSIVAQYDAVELLARRDQVSQQIAKEMNDRCQNFFLLLDDVSITHLEYGPEFTRAVEQKQVAQQDAERQKFVVMRSEQERKATVIKAEGESEAARLVSDAVSKSGSGFIEVQRIDAAREIAETLAKSRNVTYLPNQEGGNGGVLLGLQ
ncbi:hypothetical protein PRNP1_014608 [Phytophthora ramorum]